MADGDMSFDRIFAAIDISASGLTAQRIRLETIAANIANAHTTRVPGGGPYRRRVAILRPVKRGDDFAALLRRVMGDSGADAGRGVEVVEVRTVRTPPKMVYEPDHPDADEGGYVAYPSVNIVEEMVDMITASRAYEANLTVLNAAKAMIARAVEI